MGPERGAPPPSDKKKPSRHGKLKATIAGVAGLSVAPGAVGGVTRTVEGAAVRTGGEVAGAVVKEVADIAAPVGAASDKPEFAQPKPEHQATQKPEIDPAWLDRLSVEQDNLINSFENLSATQKDFLRQAIFVARRIKAEGYQVNEAAMVAQTLFESSWGSDAPQSNLLKKIRCISDGTCTVLK